MLQIMHQKRKKNRNKIQKMNKPKKFVCKETAKKKFVFV